jgi:hypothetical protein
LEADRAAAKERLDSLEAEVQRVVKRLTAARRAAAALPDDVTAATASNR